MVITITPIINDISVTAENKIIQITPDVTEIKIYTSGLYQSGSGGGGGGTGDVIAPATNSADYIPQWDGSNSKKLKNGLPVPDGGLAGLTALGLKVDKVSGKELSTNDYTTSEKNKLSGIQAGAQVNPDLSGYALTSNVNIALSGKVDKVSGKGLSENDYTTAEKNKLNGIASGAEVNVNADWNATSGDAQILNKPPMPAAQIQSDWAQTDSEAVDFIKNKVNKAFQTLSEAATITWDAAISVNGTVTLTASRILSNISNAVAGEIHTIAVTQGGSGSYVLTFGNQYRFAGGVIPPLTSTVGAVDLISFIAVSTTEFHLYNFIPDSKAL